MRKLGNIISDLENLAEEMYMEHDMQLGDVWAIIKAYTEKHFPEAIEEYDDGTYPVHLFGHKDDVKKWARSIK